MQRLISSLKADSYLKDPRIEATLRRVDRAHYCPSPQPYADSPFQIGYGATISAPHMHAFALEALKDKLVNGAKVLDVGSGSGFLTSCMAHLVGPDGVVYGVDHIKELVKQAVSNIEKDCKELLTSGRVCLIDADGRLGFPEHAPFDAIHVGATTSDEVILKLIEQLKPGGRIVSPVRHGEKQIFECIDKSSEGTIERKQLLSVVYVPLTSVESQVQRG